MKRKILILVIGSIAIILAVLSIRSCGGQRESGEEIGYSDQAFDKAMGEVDIETAENELSVAGNSETDAAQQRKLIKSWSLVVEALAFDDLLTHIESTADKMGGYVESSSISGISYGTDGLRSAELTIRVPVEQLDSLVKDIKAEGNVTYEGKEKNDVTLQYTDVESHKTALNTEYDRLLEILEKAETVEDIVAIEARLSEVRYQLEYYESQIRTYDNLIEYGTVTLSIIEVKQETPVEEQGIWTVIKEGFLNSLSNIGNGIKSIVINFMIAIPYLVVILLIVLAGYFIARIIKKGRDKNAEKK